MFNEAFSKGSLFNEDGKNKEFMKITEFAAKYGIDTIYTVLGMYTHTKGKFGESGIIITSAANIDVPEHLIKDIKTVRANADMVEAVNNGKCGLKISTYVDKKGIERYTATFVDI